MVNIQEKLLNILIENKKTYPINKRINSYKVQRNIPKTFLNKIKLFLSIKNKFYIVGVAKSGQRRWI